MGRHAPTAPPSRPQRTIDQYFGRAGYCGGPHIDDFVGDRDASPVFDAVLDVTITPLA
jgi:hypothetical protein